MRGAPETADCSSVKDVARVTIDCDRRRYEQTWPPFGKNTSRLSGSSMKGVTVRLGSALIRDALKVMADGKAPDVTVRHERERSESAGFETLSLRLVMDWRWTGSCRDLDITLAHQKGF